MDASKYNLTQVLFFTISLLVASFLSFQVGKLQTREARGTQSPLRLSGYYYTSPLIACDVSDTTTSGANLALQEKLDTTIREGIAAKKIARASVMYRDLTSGLQLVLNKEERFFPASLKKVPLMMAVLSKSESDTNLLSYSDRLTILGDTNATEIPPRQAPIDGQRYTVNELMEMMIRYSDNSSYEVLNNIVGPGGLQDLYTQLNIPFPELLKDSDSYTNIIDTSLFFRSLYNASYVNRDNSERALELLATADYDNGIVKGVDADIKVANKFGIATVFGFDKRVNTRQLHDCGIVYDGDKPYLLCIMTEGDNQNIQEQESVIADISKTVFDFVKR